MNVAQRLFGLETEYALSALGFDGTRLDQGRVVSSFMGLAQRELPHLPGRAGGIFLGNGSRLYVDTGGHPELSTPELVNPWDACRYSLAGDRIVNDLASRFPAHDWAAQQVFVTRCNISYGPAGPTTWGAHESYCHRADPAALAVHLVPHLASRVIYTGAGGFNNRTPGLEFMVSPRVAHLELVVSGASTGSRGIYHTKNESLSCDGVRRLHVICGESVCSQAALWLKVAVTAIVVALVEAGLSPCWAIQLQDPLGAMQRFAVDVEGVERAQCADGQRRTALEMQRLILGQIERHARHPLMPPWTPQACDLLGQILDRLEQGPVGAAKTLDWAIKLALYQEFARRRGVSWESLTDWNYVLVRLFAALQQRLGPTPPTPVSDELLCGAKSLVPDEAAQLGRFLKRRGKSWDELKEILKLRQELFELDTRFSQLGEQGVFAALDRTGALDHHVPGVDNIQHAMANPPATGRARLRGECVQRCHRLRGQYWCDWTGVWDHNGRRYLDLLEPFATEEKWREIPRVPAS